MSNLKKVLSAGLASTMIMGMMATASATAYEDLTDKSEIKHTEAVNTMVSLGVVSGKDNGAFDPNGSLTRAEACTLIARMLGGGKDPVLGSNVKSNFKDTQGHWAEKYIAYCANLGIIAGKGDGNFDPNGSLTGSAAAKMILCALGYKPEFEGIGGANWELATNTLATKIDLYDGLEDLNPSAAISRDAVSQMIYNGVQAQEVEYRNLQGDHSSTLYAVESGTMLANRFGVVKVEGVVAANETFGLGTDEGATLAGKTKLVDTQEYTYGGRTYDLDGIYPIAISSDLMGQRVVLYVKFNNNLSPNASSSTVLGEPIVSDKTTVVETTKRLKNADKVRDALKGTGLSVVSSTKGVAYKYDGETETASATGIQNTAGVRQRFIDNDDDGKVDVIISETAALSKVSAYKEKDEKLTLSGIGSVNFADIADAASVKKDDYVLAAWIGGDLHVAKAESVTGKLESYKKGETLTVAGTKYDVSQIAGYTGGDDDIEAAANVDNAYLDTEATFYLDQNGMVVAVGDATENGGNYAYVWAGSNNSNNGIDSNRVKVTLQDGTTKTYDLDGDTDKDIKAAVKKLAVGNADHSDALARVYAYSIGSDGEIKLSDAKGGNGTSGTVAFEKNKTYVGNLLDANGASKTKYASSSTVFFYVSIKDNEIDDVDVYTGYASAPSVDNVKAYAAYNNGNNMAAVAFTGGSITGKDVADHLFVTDILGHNQDNTTTIKAILAGSDKETEIKVDESNFNVETNKDETGLYLYTVNTDGTYKLTAAKNAGSKDILTPSGVEKISSKTIAIADDAEYKLTSKTVVVEIDGKNFDDFDNAYVGSLPSNNDRALVREVLVNGDDEVLMIVKGLDSSSTPVAPSESGYTANVKDVNGTLTLTKYVGDTYSKSEIISMIKAGLDDVKSVTANADGTYTVTFNDGNVITYNFTTVDMCKVVSDGAITFVKRGSTVETKNDADVKTAIATTVNKAVSYSLVSATSYTVNANETVLVTVYKMDIATHSLTSAVSGYKTADGAALTPAKGSAGNVWLAEGDTATVKSTANNTITVSGAKSTWSTKSTEGEIFTMPAETVTAETAPTPVAVAVTLSGVIDGKFTADSNTFAVTMTGAEGAKSGDVVTVTVKSTNVVSGNTTLKLTATNGSAIRPSTITFENGTEGKEYKFEVTLAQSTSTETLTLAKN